MSTTSQIDEAAATVTRTLTIAAPRDLVWAALTAPVQIAQWFGQRAEFPDGISLGATGSFGWTGEGDFPARIDAYEPTQRFAFTWGTPGEDLREDNSTTATFTLTVGVGGAGGLGSTVLTVIETGFDTLSEDAAKRRAAMEDNANGWNTELDQLDAHVLGLVNGADPRADLEAGTITHTVVVAAAVEQTWAALTDPAAIEAWWGHPAEFPDGVEPGSVGTFEWIGHGVFPMRIERYEPPSAAGAGRFDLRWGELGERTPGATASLVEFTITPAGARSLVTVVETGFTHLDTAARRAAMDDNTTGWREALAGLVRHVEADRS